MPITHVERLPVVNIIKALRSYIATLESYLTWKYPIYYDSRAVIYDRSVFTGKIDHCIFLTMPPFRFWPKTGPYLVDDISLTIAESNIYFPSLERESVSRWQRDRKREREREREMMLRLCKEAKRWSSTFRLKKFAFFST